MWLNPRFKLGPLPFLLPIFLAKQTKLNTSVLVLVHAIIKELFDFCSYTRPKKKRREGILIFKFVFFRVLLCFNGENDEVGCRS